jgi:hypothetical protein
MNTITHVVASSDAVTMHFNFTGHPVAGLPVAPFVGVNFPADGAGLAETIREVLLALPGREQLLAGASATVALPGLAHAAGILLAEWHGQFGSFPRICWAVRGPDGFAWPDTATANLADIRESARTAR